MNKKATAAIITATAITLLGASPAHASGFKVPESNPRMDYTPAGLVIEWDLVDSAGHPYATESYEVWGTEWLHAERHGVFVDVTLPNGVDAGFNVPVKVRTFPDGEVLCGLPDAVDPDQAH